MEMKLLPNEQLEHIYKRDLQISFPRAELKPLRAMQEKYRDGSYRPWGLFDGEEIVGTAFVWAYEDGWRLFDYLCVSPQRRNDGLGSLLIQKLVEAESGNVLFGESEIPEFAPDPAIAARRIAFYKRNGAKEAGYDMTLFGVPYRTLYWAERKIAPEEIMKQHTALYQRRFGRQGSGSIYDKYVKIPWSIADGIPEKINWAEVEERSYEDSGI